MTKRDKPTMLDEDNTKLARAREFTSIYNNELARLKNEYGETAKGKISYNKIKRDIATDTAIDYSI